MDKIFYFLFLTTLIPLNLTPSESKIIKEFYYPTSGTAIYEDNIADNGTIKIYFKPDNKGYIIIKNVNDRSSASVVIYDRILYKDVIIPIKFKNILSINFDDFIKTTEALFDWDLLIPSYNKLVTINLQSIIKEIKTNLEFIDLSEGQIMDDKGNWKNIRAENKNFINTYGFTKWIADGFYKQSTGKLLKIDNLLEENFKFEDEKWFLNYPTDLDPFFGLNWIKNIGYSLNNLSVPDISLNFSDVKDIPYLRFSENTGYDVKNLNFILYYLAAKNPNNFYFVAFNRPQESTTTKGRLMVTYYKTGVIFPIIDYTGLLSINYFETGKYMTSFENVKFYDDENIFFVKILPKKYLKLPKIKNLSIIYR